MWLLIIRWKSLPKGKKLNSVGNGMSNAFPLVIGCSMLAGFGAVIQSTAACDFIIDTILNVNLSPHILAFVAMLIISALIADGVSSQVLFCTTIGESLLATGANAGALHRIITMTATVTDSLPHSSMIYMQLNVFGYTHKQAYKYLFVVTVIIPLITASIATAMACIMY
ncbi:MAG: hypothetical protein LUG57_10465 [Oscillospiraceae bacterium]|nr:hypothetical protein [Oscillospiraceae bacterium]